MLGTLNNRCRIIIRTPKGTLNMTTTHVEVAELLKCFDTGNGSLLGRVSPKGPQDPIIRYLGFG